MAQINEVVRTGSSGAYIAVSNLDGSEIGGGDGWSVQVTPTVGTAAYVAGDSIGGVITFAAAGAVSGRQVIIDSILVTDASNQSIPFTIQFFSATPTGGTYTDGSALVYAAGDPALCVGQVRVLATDWINYPATPTDGFVSINDIGLTATLAATSLFALIIADVGASTTLTAADIIIRVSGRRI